MSYSKEEMEAEVSRLSALGLREDEIGYVERGGRYVILIASRLGVDVSIN